MIDAPVPSVANEFAIIEQYFSSVGRPAAGTLVGIGDDAAVVEVAPDQHLVVSMDTLLEGRHFPRDTNPGDIAYKALAVNLSDLAAMAATPAWFLLSLTLADLLAANTRWSKVKFWSLDSRWCTGSKFRANVKTRDQSATNLER